jgi:hypothetical protein
LRFDGESIDPPFKLTAMLDKRDDSGEQSRSDRR